MDQADERLVLTQAYINLDNPAFLIGAFDFDCECNTPRYEDRKGKRIIM